VSAQLHQMLTALGPDEVEAASTALNIMADAAFLTEPEQTVLLALGAALIDPHMALYSATLGSAVEGRELAATEVIRVLCASAADTEVDPIIRSACLGLARELRGVVLALGAIEHGHPRQRECSMARLGPISLLRAARRGSGTDALV